MGTVYNESGLSQDAQEIHRALASLIEELEAVDWYNQRMDVTQDEALRAILEHNRNEEIEHAAMALEWLRRKLPKFDEELFKFVHNSISALKSRLEKSSRNPSCGCTENDCAGDI